MTSALERLIAEPRLLERDSIELAAPPSEVWARIRHGDLGTSRLVRVLFGLRTLPSRLMGHGGETTVFSIDAIDAIDAPGFHVLDEQPGREITLGAIGQVWRADIPFLDMRDAERFAAFAEPGYARVAWALRVEPAAGQDSRLTVEVRVDTTDDESWRRFRDYFRFIGPGSRFVRRSLMAALERELGSPDAAQNDRPLHGDEWLPDATDQLTDSIVIAAPPDAIWPWLLQMGCRRAGFYSIDLLDNASERSATELHPELQSLKVGDVLPATPDSDEGFEVLALEPPHCLVLGGLFDPEGRRQLPFAAARPERFWQVSWVFLIEPDGAARSRITVRARVKFAGDRLHASWIRPTHRLMERAQLRNLAARVEGRLPRDDWREVLAGLGGAAGVAFTLLTPFLSQARSHWGVDEATVSRAHPGDELVPEPRWSWTHGIEVDAPAAEVWPWVAQLGAERGGFYSYQWLENLAGCRVKNAEVIHPEWQAKQGDALHLHPDMPPFEIVALDPGRSMVVHGPPDAAARARGERWATASWLFMVEPLDAARCRIISRFRADGSHDLATYLMQGPLVTNVIGFVMDRRMLQGIKQRAERTRGEALRSG